MKKFSKKVKSILAISIALICAIAIAVTAIIIGKKDKDPQVPTPELNKNAQQFLTAQKDFGDAIALRQDNSQNVFYADASKFEGILNQSFDVVNGNVLVIRQTSGDDWKSIYYLGKTDVSEIELPVEPDTIDKIASDVFFVNGKVIVRQDYINRVADNEEYSIWLVLNVKDDGTAEILTKKKVSGEKVVYNYYAGENYFGLVYSDGTSAEIEIVSYNSEAKLDLTTIDIDAGGEPQVAFSEHSCLYEANEKPFITFISNSAVKLQDVEQSKSVIYVGADKYLVETETNGSFSYELVKLSSSSNIEVTPFALGSGYSAIYGKNYEFGSDNTFGSGVSGYAKVVSMKKDTLGNLKTTDAEIAYYDYNMNLVATFVSDVTDSIIASSSIYTETEINKGDSSATEKIAYTTYYLTAKSGLVSIEQTRTADSIMNLTNGKYIKAISGAGENYRSDYVAVKNTQNNYRIEFIDYKGQSVFVDNTQEVSVVLYVNEKTALVVKNGQFQVLEIETGLFKSFEGIFT